MVHNPPSSPPDDCHTNRLHSCTPHSPETHTLRSIRKQLVKSGMKLKISIQIFLHWIPTHIRILGNEEADRLANFATTLDTIQTCAETKKKTNTHFNDYYTIYTGTALPYQIIDTKIRILRWHSYSRQTHHM